MANIPRFQTRKVAIIVGWAKAHFCAVRTRLLNDYGRGGHALLCPPCDFYLGACHSLTRLEISEVTGSRIVEGVREKRGAGAGWFTP